MIETTDICSVLVPADITPAMITSTTLTSEDPNPAWSAATTYALGDRVYSASTHRVYESLKASNLNKDPTIEANRINSAGVGTWWQDADPTNQYAMFDGLVSTQTVAPSPFTITLRPGAHNGFALFGMDADTITITDKSAPGGTVLYSYSDDLEGSDPADYYEWLFDRFKPQTQMIVTGLEPYGGSELTITFTKGSGLIKVGMLAIGDMRPIGAPLRGATAEPQDFSYIKTDEFGRTKVKKRYNATGLAISVKLLVEDASSVLDTIRELLGVPCVVVGSAALFYEGLTTFGLISARHVYGEGSDFGMVTINMTVKGMI